jgi:hypothetical protein
MRRISLLFHWGVTILTIPRFILADFLNRGDLPIVAAIFPPCRPPTVEYLPHNN